MRNNMNDLFNLSKGFMLVKDDGEFRTAKSEGLDFETAGSIEFILKMATSLIGGDVFFDLEDLDFYDLSSLADYTDGSTDITDDFQNGKVDINSLLKIGKFQKEDEKE